MKKPVANTLNDNSGEARLLYDRKAAARQLSISIRSIDYFLARGEFKTRRVGRKVLITHQSLVQFASRDHWQPVDSQGESVA